MSINNKVNRLLHINKQFDIEDFIFLEHQNTIKYQNKKILPFNKTYNNNLCWLNTSVDSFIKRFKQKNNLVNFNLSLSYFLFWHYYEQCIRYFDVIAKNKNLKPSIVKYVIDCGIDDSGNWHDFKNIIEKYGCIPDKSMKATYFFKNTEDLNIYLSRHMQSFAIKYLANNDDNMKNECLKEVFSFLCTTLGFPPSEFNVRYKNLNNKYLTIKSSAKDFSKYVFEDINDYVCIIKTKNLKLCNTTITNISDYNYKYYNVDSTTFKLAIDASIKEYGQLSIGVDCRYGANHNCNLFDYTPQLYKEKIGLAYYPTEDNIYNTYSICTNHNMILIDKISKNLLVCFNNYFLKGEFCFLSEIWFDKFCQEAVVNKKFLNINNFKKIKNVDIITNLNYI